MVQRRALAALPNPQTPRLLHAWAREFTATRTFEWDVN